MNWTSFFDTGLDAIRILIIPLMGILVWLIKVLIQQNSRIQRLENLTLTKDEYQIFLSNYARMDERMKSMQNDISEIKELLKKGDHR